MFTESSLIERVESFARHLVFAGSDSVMAGVLEDLADRVGVGQIGEATYRRLREMLLGSPHFRHN